MSEIKLLREFYELKPSGDVIKHLNEAEVRLHKEGKVKFLVGTMQRADAPNRNNRIYPRSILEKEMQNYLKLVKENRALGEMDHPESYEVSLKNASHIVKDMWWEGDDMKGKIQILSTPKGEILSSLVEDGVTVGISSRGLGSTSKRNGSTMVESDYQLICFDVVADPSTTGAFMLSESVDMNKIFSKEDILYRKMNNILGV